MVSDNLTQLTQTLLLQDIHPMQVLIQLPTLHSKKKIIKCFPLSSFRVLCECVFCVPYHKYFTEGVYTANQDVNTGFWIELLKVTGCQTEDQCNCFQTPFSITVTDDSSLEYPSALRGIFNTERHNPRYYFSERPQSHCKYILHTGF